MADALVSPAVGGTMIVLTAGITRHSVKKIQNQLDDKKIPLMGVMGAFVFAAQMINFSIPGTGSSGHIGGGMLLAVLLGPYAGFLTMASVLLIQALFFADGGLLALGANIFNLGFYTCFIGYPLIYKLATARIYSAKRIIIASMISSIIALQMGAFSVVLQTFFSGRTELPFVTFVLLMQPIHLAIGIVEGIITAVVVLFIWKARPEIIESSALNKPLKTISIKKVLVILSIGVLAIGGVFSSFASNNPDGLEWSIAKTSGTAEIKTQSSFYTKLSEIQNKIAFLPGYSFKGSKEVVQPEDEDSRDLDKSIDTVTSLSGILGGLIIIAFAIITGVIIALFKRIKIKNN